MGPLVKAFTGAWQAQGVPAAFAALLPLQYGERAGGMHLAPPVVMIQAYLTTGGDPYGMKAAGLPVAAVVAADLQGDGTLEVWVRLERFDPDAPLDYLAVHLPGAGWRVGEVGPLPPGAPAVEPAPDGSGQVLRFQPVGEYDWERLSLTADLQVRFERTAQFPGMAPEWTRPLLPPAVQRCREPMSDFLMFEVQ